MFDSCLMSCKIYVIIVKSVITQKLNLNLSVYYFLHNGKIHKKKAAKCQNMKGQMIDTKKFRHRHTRYGELKWQKDLSKVFA